MDPKPSRPLQSPLVRAGIDRGRMLLLAALLLALTAELTHFRRAEAATAESPAEFVVSLIQRVRQPGKLRDIVFEAIDVDDLGRRALGERWEVLDVPQRQRYRAAYRAYFLRVAEKYFDPARDFDFGVLGSRRIGDKESLVAIRLVPSGGSERDVHWYIRTQPKIAVTDIATDGVLLSASHRRELEAILESSNGDLEALPDAIDRLVP